MLNMFSLLNVNKAVKEREEREGGGETGRERKGDHGIDCGGPFYLKQRSEPS